MKVRQKKVTPQILLLIYKNNLNKLKNKRKLEKYSVLFINNPMFST